MDSMMIQEKVNKFIGRSKELGIKVTPQRIAIYKELASTDQHPSTETIYKKIKDYYPNISLTTVYRTLETFEKLGLISVVNVLYNAARYDANLDPHHHIVCTECKKVEDVYDESLNNLDISNKTLGDYKVEGYSLLLSGVCTSCRSN
ncbi:MAG: transcriptional repressor [Thermodesulfobacteriota bacterium]|jgi:Fur family peroxide stress response transcriptional regulator|nr:transcriptional repressor [Candidatus Dadabacteria bacterium]MCZ6555011.1 transcriptional repressor [Candidatus Dadabacteria bacterium]MCZ6638763.1 transcriptional repressor [Candidatus Dadabacteria bacterium]MCZ6791870.1 transcriptional repressor [Candidatus Dadabacteria bacterium]